MDFDQLSQLVAIEREGSISAAAAALHMTQPSLSRSMARLERDLGQELFVRSRNRATLSEAGRIALAHARTLLDAERLLREELDEHARNQRTLRVASVAPAPVWHLTARLVKASPGIIVETEVVEPDEVMRRLLGGGCDLAITLAPTALPTIRSVELMHEDLCASLPLGHRLARRDAVTFAELDGMTILVYGQVGFWSGVHRRNLPHSRLIVQDDRNVLLQLVESTELACFATNVTGTNPAHARRRVVPIRDADAHATYHLEVRDDAPRRVREAFEAACP